MRVFIIALFVVLSVFAILQAASQPRSLGLVTMSSSTFTGGAALWQRTKSEINSLLPATTGQLIYCSDCVNGPSGTIGIICVSTGSMQAFQWTRSTGSECR